MRLRLSMFPSGAMDGYATHLQSSPALEDSMFDKFIKEKTVFAERFSQNHRGVSGVVQVACRARA